MRDPKRRDRRGHEVYRKIYNETPVMMHSIDAQGKVVSVNDFWLKKLGYERDEVLGRPSVDFLTAQSRKYATEVVLPKYFKTGVCENIPYQMVTRDGRVLDVLLSATAERGADGNIVMSRAMTFDVSEMRRAQEEREDLLLKLEQTNAQLEQFTYTVSHDLKSPLFTISGFLGMLEKDAARGDLDRMRSDIARIRDVVDKMRHLLEELLELSRVGRVIHAAEEVSLTELAREAAELVCGSGDGEAEIEIEIAPDLPTVRCDRLRMLQVFQNLLANARKFLGDQGEPRISVGSRGEDEKTICFVRDNGIGIERENQEKIFDIFEKMDPEVDGTGIGLALVKRIVEAHGGQIWVESEGLGTGTTFCFTVPKAPAAA